MKIAVMDAQGAGLGQTIIKKLRKDFGKNIYIIALGTNSKATANMIKAGADLGLTGEKDIYDFCTNEKTDSIIGPIGILCSGGINGEITPLIAHAVFNISCTKYILPLQVHGIFIPGARNFQIKQLIEEILADIKSKLNNDIGGL